MRSYKDSQICYIVTLTIVPAQRVKNTAKDKELFRSSHPEVFRKNSLLKYLEELTGKHLCWSLFLDKVASLQPATLSKKRVGHRCFSMNFANFCVNGMTWASVVC